MHLRGPPKLRHRVVPLATHRGAAASPTALLVTHAPPAQSNPISFSETPGLLN
jgi:hypothetical protein